jgi:pathogenesis-related protein 1
MKFSLALYISIVTAKTVFVTQTHLVTIYEGDSQKTVELVSPKASVAAQEAPAPKEESVVDQAQPTEAVAKAAFVPSTLTTKTSSPTETASTGSGIYADIDKSSGLDKSFAKSILDAHNDARSKHSAPALAWDQQVYQYAQDYADKYDCSGQLTHSGGQYGENLAVGYSSGPLALDAWYDEGQTYDYSSANSFDHFTQVVWKSTTKLGCAYKDCSAQNWGKYIICSYDPAGNFGGQSKLNVFAN